MVRLLISTKITLFVWLLVCFEFQGQAQLIFNETFGEGDDATTGSDDLGGVSWLTACPTCLDGGDYLKVLGGKLEGQDTNGPAKWTSSSINISSCDFIEIELDLEELGTMEGCGTGCNSVDWVMLEYNIDGAGWVTPPDATYCAGECADVFVIQADDILAGSMHYTTGCIEGGSTLLLRISVQAWAASEKWMLDNVTVSCAIGPEIDAGEDQVVCEGTAVVLTVDNPDGAVIGWNNSVIDGVAFTPDLGSDDYIVTASLDGCVARDTVVITVVDEITVTVDPAGPFTTVSGLQALEALPPGGTWSATCGVCVDPTTGEFDPAIAGPGTWTVCYEAGIAPCSDEECIEIVVTTGECEMEGSIISNDPTCFGFSDGSVTINVTGVTGDVIYVITDETGTVLNVDNSNTANSLTEGWYYFNISDEFPCVLIDSVYLTEPPQMEVSLTIENPLCYNDFSGAVYVDEVLNAQGDLNLISYVWNPNPSGENGVGVDTLINLNAGNYILIVTDANGCSITQEFSLINPDSLYFIQFGYLPAQCRLYGYQNGNGSVYGAAVGGVPDYDYLWENLETGETSNNTTWGGLNPGFYTLTATDANGCQLVQTIYVDSLNPIANFIATSPNFTGELEGTLPLEVHFVNDCVNYTQDGNPFADTSFFWNFGIGDDIFTKDFFEEFDVTYDVAGTYVVCIAVINKNGCADTACKIITVYDPFYFSPVNIFSPNNDGINDVFSFDFKALSIVMFECVLVNRWGVKVAEINAINGSWDGILQNGMEAQEGVYFYTYKGITADNTNFEGQGTVQLVRK